MPDISVYFRPGLHVSVTQQREQLAARLAAELPPMMVKALGQAGVLLGETQMTVNIVQYHPQAQNVADLAVGVMLAPGEHDCVVAAASCVRDALCEDVLSWLAVVGPEYAYGIQGLDELDVSLRFARVAGMSCDIPSGTTKSVWG